ncbi:MAG: hydrogenase formation protein HypD [Armatimonadota bacterium]|nr:hydrogenase formation protein HypD [Armatimonadota bacterium]
MRYVDEFRNSTLAQNIAEHIKAVATQPLKLMEVCGTHTMAIAKYGIKNLLPANIKLISGPGCPVCVTPQALIDSFIQLGRLPNVTLATFGDMMKVPGSRTTLEAERARGADIRVVYSPLDAVKLAQENHNKQVIFFGIGFETTAPAIALTIKEAMDLGLSNFYVLPANKLIPPAMMALAGDSEIGINGFICPGHVSTIIGSAAYESIAHGCGIPCVISGFEPLDILQSILMLVMQITEGRSNVEIQYSRAVNKEGNREAMECVNEVFEPCDAEWRGLGMLPNSGLRLRPQYARFDAAQLLGDCMQKPLDNGVCECGLILKGLKAPLECRAFGRECTPEHPLGPCMVSTEGACSAEYRYTVR